MTDCTLKQQLQSDMKASMKNADKPRLAVIRLMLSAIKQIEVDERIELDDARVTSVLDKMVKQRRESISQFEKAGRDDLIAVEQFELELIQQYLPEALAEDEINKMIADAIATSGATEMKQMGQVMAILKPQLTGRADMGQVSQQIKNMLGAS